MGCGASSLATDAQPDATGAAAVAEEAQDVLPFEARSPSTTSLASATPSTVSALKPKPSATAAVTVGRAGSSVTAGVKLVERPSLDLSLDSAAAVITGRPRTSPGDEVITLTGDSAQNIVPKEALQQLQPLILANSRPPGTASNGAKVSLNGSLKPPPLPGSNPSPRKSSSNGTGSSSSSQNPKGSQNPTSPSSAVSATAQASSSSNGPAAVADGTWRMTHEADDPSPLRPPPILQPQERTSQQNQRYGGSAYLELTASIDGDIAGLEAEEEEEDDDDDDGPSRLTLTSWKRHYKWNKKKPRDLLDTLWRRFDPTTHSLWVVSHRYHDGIFAPYQGDSLVHGLYCRIEAAGILPLMFGVLHVLYNYDADAYKIVGVFLFKGQKPPAALIAMVDFENWSWLKADPVNNAESKSMVAALLASGLPSLGYKSVSTREFV